MYRAAFLLCVYGLPAIANAMCSQRVFPTRTDRRLHRVMTDFGLLRHKGSNAAALYCRAGDFLRFR